MTEHDWSKKHQTDTTGRSSYRTHSYGQDNLNTSIHPKLYIPNNTKLENKMYRTTTSRASALASIFALPASWTHCPAHRGIAQREYEKQTLESAKCAKTSANFIESHYGRCLMLASERARAPWATFSLVLPITFEHTTNAYRSPFMAVTGTSHFVMKPSATCSAAPSHSTTFWVAVVYMSGYDNPRDTSSIPFLSPSVAHALHQFLIIRYFGSPVNFSIAMELVVVQKTTRLVCGRLFAAACTSLPRSLASVSNFVCLYFIFWFARGIKGKNTFTRSQHLTRSFQSPASACRTRVTSKGSLTVASTTCQRSRA